MAFVYILQDGNCGKYYIGSTVDLNRRLKEHLKRYVESTKNFKEVNLVFFQKYENDHLARMIEKKLKKFKRRDFLVKIINDGFIKTNPTNA